MEEESGSYVKVQIKKSSSKDGKIGWDIDVKNNTTVDGHQQVMEEMSEIAIKVALKTKIALEGGM